MKNRVTKISFIIVIGLISFGCSTTKRVPDGKMLLIKNEIIVNNKKNDQEEVYNQLYQKQNTSILGYHLRLNIFNLAKPKTDSIYRAKFSNNPDKYFRKVKWLSKKQVKRLGESFWYSGIHDFLRKTGEAPVILDTVSSRKSLTRLKSYYFNKGYFDVKTSFNTKKVGKKKSELKYSITTGNSYTIDSLGTKIMSPQLDSLYQANKNYSLLKKGNQYNTKDFEEEKNRITSEFRNNGAFRFQPNYVSYEIDTLKKNHTAKVNLIIENEKIIANDSSKTLPFKLYKIGKVNIYTDHIPSKPNETINDSTSFNGVTLYSVKKLKYHPKAITDGVFVTKGNYFSDDKTTLTSKSLSNLKVFNYPLIQYIEDKKNANSLIANIYLTPRKKYTWGYSTDFTHSNIQQFGITGSTSLVIRNVFNGAETFEIGVRGNIGSSKDLANPKNNFFNISEIGTDAKLNFPRLFLPFKTESIIPKTMIPFTTLSVGFFKQTNIGLDKQNFTTTLSYNWTPKKNRAFHLELINIQFVKNVNPSNYYNIYQTSYNTLNSLAQQYNANPNYFSNNNLVINSGVDSFINDVNNGTITASAEDIKTIRSIKERQIRLTENNLIFASNVTYNRTSKKDLFDNNFYSYKLKVESAGDILSLFAKFSKQLKNQNGANTIFDVEYSQYIKTEGEFIKHWDLSRKRVFATRAFAGIAIPYGNSTSIPFSRSYFAGGSNDIRAWQSYGLGPGKTGSLNDFNEANMKLMFNSEFRFNIFNQFNGGIFIDAGNIWNISDITTDQNAIFAGLKSLENIAVGTGFGIRYDFSFFLIRLDLAFKTYNPAITDNDRWFKEMRFDKSVLNIGINYPF